MSRIPRNAVKVLVVFVALLFNEARSEQQCEFYFNGCPEDFNNDTLVVPEKVVALTASINACEPTKVLEGISDSGGPPSIMFVIDHSLSMMGIGRTYPGNDSYGSRFRVVCDIVDSIYQKFPNAEMGVVVFREVLYFDHRNLPYATALPGYGDQSYIPLLKLNGVYAQNKTGLQVIKDVLRTDTLTARNESRNIDVKYVDLLYKPQFSTDGNTNINNAFAATTAAMSATTNSKHRQFVIFLSDGEPNPDNVLDSKGRDPYWFAEGKNIPTTFTVYLSSTEITPPTSLMTMNTNIQKNGYSSSNPSSEIWSLTSEYASLMKLVMESIVTPIYTIVNGRALRLSINNIVTTRYVDNKFQYTERFPLNNYITPFNVVISYRLTDKNTGRTFDTSTVTNFYVKRGVTDNVSSGIALNCWERSLGLYYGGQPVTSITENMSELEIRLTTSGGTYVNVPVELTHLSGTTRDKENLVLTQSNGTWTTTFKREISSTPYPGDKRLQHNPVDSIVITYRNPALPLDTIRLSYPFTVSKAIAAQSAAYFDNNGDGFIDSIYVGVVGELNPGDLTWISNNLVLPPSRNFTMNSIGLVNGGLALKVTENSSTPNTGVTAQDRMTIRSGVLPNGGYFQESNVPIEDRVPPVLTSAILVSGQSTTDTLKVTFSEQLDRVESLEPFNFAKKDGSRYQITLSAAGTINGDKGVFLITQNDSVISITPNDSIWINPAASIRDKQNNIQDDPENRRTLVTIKQVPYTVEIEVVNNPLTPGSTTPEWVREIFRSDNLAEPPSQGLIVRVKPTQELRSHMELSGKASVYDVVKNVIIRDVEMAFDTRTKRLYFVWDGRNSNGRKVAAGTYTAVLRIKDNQNSEMVKQVPIGVRR